MVLVVEKCRRLSVFVVSILLDFLIRCIQRVSTASVIPKEVIYLDNLQYDEGFKSMFAYKALLAITLKALIPEYKDSSVEDIRDKYIQGDPVGNSDRINLSGTGVEDGKVKYDIRFDSLLPEPTGKHMRVLINIEGQKDSKSLPYDIVTRGIYYACNMISSEYGTVFDHSHYEKMEKVYSIWISMTPDKKAKGNILRYKITEENHSSDYRKNREDYDKLEVILMNLGPIDDTASMNYNEKVIFGIYTDIFSGSGKSKEVIEKLENEFGVEFPRTAKEAIDTVCNLNEVIEERGRIEGREQGAEQAKLENAIRLIANGKLPLEDIASCLDLPLERVQELAAKKPA